MIHKGAKIGELWKSTRHSSAALLVIAHRAQDSRKSPTSQKSTPPGCRGRIEPRIRPAKLRPWDGCDAYAEHVPVRESAVAHLAPSVDVVCATMMPLAGLTALPALRDQDVVFDTVGRGHLRLAAKALTELGIYVTTVPSTRTIASSILTLAWSFGLRSPASSQANLPVSSRSSLSD